MSGDFRLWAVCAAVVLAAHGAVGFALRAPRAFLEAEAGSPVVMLDLAPVAPVAEPPSAAAEPPAPPPEPTLSALPPDSTLAPPSVANPESESVPPPVPAAEAPPTPVFTRQAASTTTSEVQATTDANARAEAARAAPGREDANASAEVQSWQRDLIAQIERHKRFPAGARGRTGIVSVSFRIDRQGHLIQSGILKSSGVPELDRAAIDLIERSQPFPQPPAALAEAELSFVAPIRYLKREGF